MEGGRVYAAASHDMIALLENSSNSLWVPSSSPSFHENMVNFDQQSQLLRRATLKRGHENGHFSRICDDDDIDAGGEEFGAKPEKKRRLTAEQVQFLEKSFEVENKLEPERKVQLAKDLGLQPRQVAIWFQNRRARYKNKQIEKEFSSLKTSYERLKVHYETLNKEKHNLQNQVKTLKEKLEQRAKGKEVNMDQPNEPQSNKEIVPKIGTHDQNGYKPGSSIVVVPTSAKQVDQDASSSAKSDIFDSDSPRCTNGNHYSSGLMEDPGDSPARMLDPEQHSDFSQDEEEHLMMSKSLLLPPTPPPPLLTFNNFLKVANANESTYDPDNVGPCNFSLVDDQPFWSWLY